MSYRKIVLSTFVVVLALLVIYFNSTNIYFCYASMFASGLGIGFAVTIPLYHIILLNHLVISFDD